MDDTLDSIRPSCDVNPQAEMSYLFGRDPSILAYGQRPCISKETKKNLMSVYEAEECYSLEENGTINSESQSFQTVKVYLRMKPFPKNLKLSQDQQNAFQITSSDTLLTKLPSLENNASYIKGISGTNTICRKFTFTRTFGPETTQLELFEQAVKQHMEDFLAGQNSTIMTYGTTNSGKSYTLQGTTTSPGIIPRCLEFVFSNITPKSTPFYKPVNHCNVVHLNPVERAQELEMKTKLLTYASMDKHHYINTYKEMQKLLQEESPSRPSQCNDVHCSVWVSFAEIYNEVVYDLLSNEIQKKRIPLKLATDSRGRAFIKGLKTVCVNSGSEAYQVLMAGQYNLKVAATALNAKSSRSHCIFTIKLLKYYTEHDPDNVEVSTFAFCDLAGSERLKKTLNIGDRLKEAQNINTSLLVLGRCLKTIHDGQLSKQKIEHVGPFRESKLTRLFQKALSGKEHIALIVNINPLPNLYVETQNVLNFSAIAKKIVIEPKEKIYKKKSRFSQIVAQSIKTETDWDATELGSEEWHNNGHSISGYVHAEVYDDLMIENERLKKEIATLKSSALSRDLQIRQEMADTYTTIMKELETEWKNRIKDVEEQQEDMLQWSVKQVEDFYKRKLDQLSSCKRKRPSLEENDANDSRNIEELEMQNSRMKSKIVLLKNNIKETKELNQSLTVEKNKLSFELSLMKDDLNSVKNLLNEAQKDVCSDEDKTCYVEELKSQLFAKQEQVKKLKVFLNEAKEEYIAITTEVREKEYTIKEQEEELLEKQETIDELETDYGNLSIQLIEKTNAVEVLDEKLKSQNIELMNYENKVQDMLEQIDKLKSEKLLLLDEIQLLKKTISTENITQDLKRESDVFKNDQNTSKDDKSQEITVTVEVSTNNKIETLNKSTEIYENIVHLTTDAQIEEKLIAVELENSGLKEKLTQSTVEIQSLKEELDLAKIKLTNLSNQINSLQINTREAKVKNEESVQHKVEVETTETGCQVYIKSEEKQVEDNENEVRDKSSQTVENTTNEEITQTSFVEFDDSDLVLDELSKLTVKYDDLKTQLKEKCQMLEDLQQEISSVKQKLKSALEESNTNTVELLQNELSLLKDGKMHLEQALKDSDNNKATLETKISDYEQRVNKTEQELLDAKIDYNQCVEKLNALQTEFNNHVSKCKNEHEETINKLQIDLSNAIEKSDIKAKCLDVHAARIMELEHNLGTVTELEKQIEELNKNLEMCQDEKEHLQNLLDENNDKLLDLEDRLESAKEMEREKDAEIMSLQTGMKCELQRNNKYDKDDKDDKDYKDDKLMEIEMKNTIRDLMETQENLCKKEKYINELEMRVKTSEENVKMLELLQQSAQERQAEIDRLRTINEELKNSLTENEHEMKTFMKNRDKMVAKYETLVKNQQEELERQRRLITKNQSKEKDYSENTSEDEVVLKERRLRRPPKKYSPTSDDISVIELPNSETKKNNKCAIFPPPTEPISERKRNTRKKKLFVTEDEFVQDIEPMEITVASTPSTLKSRSLRTRRK
ncbi:uncharacterized protein LOC116426957 [Nomia melanderi]|uniref:uncharacterized protein LOC116426957 n=1 Tax=Nomia melanderi TaxID=2448451 RepID=UPI0013045848|nr:kinesin-like protein KIF20B [Nomia melanderi]